MAARSAGEREFVRECVGLLSGVAWNDDTLFALAGPAAGVVIEAGPGSPHDYWPRVWAMRAFLYAWDPSAILAVLVGARDPHWRVREMSAKVVARRLLDEAFEAMVDLEVDDVARVRAAAARALVRLAHAPS